MKKKKKSKLKTFLKILLIFAVIAGLIYGAYYVYINYFDVNKKDKIEVKILKEIPKYGYGLKENATKLYKENFDELDKTLSKEEVDYEEYAKIVSKLFIIDFYTLDNKLSKNDIGGTDFIEDDMKDNFINEARSTFYKYVEVKDKRTQILPIVSSIDDISIEQTKFFVKDLTITTTSSKKKVTTQAKGEEKDAYKVSIKWSYEEDLGYETEANLILINKDNKLYVVEMD